MMRRVALSVVVIAIIAIPCFAQKSATAARTGKSAPSQPVRSFEQVSSEAIAAFEANRDEYARQLLQAGLKMKPDWEEGLLSLGTMYYEEERFAESRELLRRLVAQNPKHGPGLVLLGLSEYKTHEYERALYHLRRAMATGVGDRKQLANATFYHVAVLLNRYEQYHDSLKLLWQMRGAGEPENLLEIPAGLAALGYPLLPEEVPQDRKELARLAGAGTFALLDQRRPDAEKFLSEMVAKYPNEPGVHYQYGLFLMGERPEAGAQEMLKEIEISPSDTQARLRLAEWHLHESRPEKAKPLLEEVIRIEPKDSSGHMLMGELMASTGDNEAAIRELELARDLAPDRQKVHWDLLRVYTAAGRKQDAEREKVEVQRLAKEQNKQ